MINPDGVIRGHYRDSLHGDDLNRRWDHPERYRILRSMLEKNDDLDRIKKTLDLDLHGHSKKKSSFIYGCYNPENPNLCK